MDFSVIAPKKPVAENKGASPGEGGGGQGSAKVATPTPSPGGGGGGGQGCAKVATPTPTPTPATRRPSQHRCYDEPYMRIPPMAYIDQISRSRRLKNVELIHSRSFRINFEDEDPNDRCSYHHHGPPVPPCRSTLPPPPPPPPPCRYRNIPRAQRPPSLPSSQCPAEPPPPPPPPCRYRNIPRAPPSCCKHTTAPPPPSLPSSQCPAEPSEMGHPYPPYDGLFSDENPNGCNVM